MTQHVRLSVSPNHIQKPKPQSKRQCLATIRVPSRLKQRWCRSSGRGYTLSIGQSLIKLNVSQSDFQKKWRLVQRHTTEEDMFDLLTKTFGRNNFAGNVDFVQEVLQRGKDMEEPVCMCECMYVSMWVCVYVYTCVCLTFYVSSCSVGAPNHVDMLMCYILRMHNLSHSLSVHRLKLYQTGIDANSTMPLHIINGHVWLRDVHTSHLTQTYSGMQGGNMCASTTSTKMAKKQVLSWRILHIPYQPGSGTCECTARKICENLENIKGQDSG